MRRSRRTFSTFIDIRMSTNRQACKHVLRRISSGGVIYYFFATLIFERRKRITAGVTRLRTASGVNIISRYFRIHKKCNVSRFVQNLYGHCDFDLGYSDRLPGDVRSLSPGKIARFIKYHRRGPRVYV